MARSGKSRYFDKEKSKPKVPAGSKNKFVTVEFYMIGRICIAVEVSLSWSMTFGGSSDCGGVATAQSLFSYSVFLSFFVLRLSQ